MKSIVKKIDEKLISVKNRGNSFVKNLITKKDAGLDGVVVTIGLMIIALLIIIVMKTSLSTFVTTLVESMTTKASNILSGT